MKSKSDISVFEKYAHEYDLMTNARQREKNHDQEVAAIVKRYKPTSVLDAGCATGLTSSLFARRGIETVGLDRSQRMLTEARKKYKFTGYPLKFQFGHFERLSKSLNGKFDLVVSLANSISGVHTLKELFGAFSNFHRVLKPGGSLVIQVLNYKGWKENELMPIRATDNDGLVYIRFSERTGRQFHIYAIRLDNREEEPKFEVFRHDFDNFSATEIVRLLKEVGFRKIEKFGNLKFTEKFGQASRDVVLTATKKAESF
ncbi:MAG: methyltransferase domain-containing protein [bacterium]|nr:methyltransferase domain-containing protein [bacterium]